ncbi:MAG: glycerophosphodiester phosphodiesterase, partial [Clostridia bacterium]|nr:glycerophosphodiester phosphodiesterase [Clostridia bacterium]
MWWLIPAVIILLAILYLMAIKGRSGKKELELLRKYSYAHRGFHGNGLPENSMAAFAAAKEKGYGIELDIHLLKDGNLAVIHDSLLKRTTGAAGRIEDLDTASLANYSLEGTKETIPQFADVLKLFEGGAPLIVELKPVDKNHAALAKAACEMLDKFNVKYCIESFDPRCVMWLKKNRPDVIRGQLSTNFFKTDEKLSFIIKFLLTHHLVNFLSKPDFVAYEFNRRSDTLSNFLCCRLWKMQA